MSQTSFTLQQQIAIGLGGVVIGLPFIAFSLDTPVSHLMLAARTRPQPHAKDLEKDDSAATEGVELVDPAKDDLVSATRKLWDSEGWRGFVKGFLPELVAQSIEYGATVALNVVIAKTIASRRTGSWRIINAVLASAVTNLVVCHAVNPAVILRTRMRLQPYKRTVKEEIRYLSRRVSVADLFRFETILPAFVRYAILAAVRAIAFVALVPPPAVDALGNVVVPQGTLHQRMMMEFLVGQGASIVGNALAFPLIRCQELAAVTLKPLEEPSVRVHEYQGIADEIVKDSAWNGFAGSLQRTVISAVFNLALVLPPFLTLQSAEKSA